MSEYSGTPLAKKLGFKAGYKILIHSAPKHYWKLFEELPEDLIIHTRKGTGPYDLIHLFCVREKEFIRQIKLLRPALKTDGSFWVSWPKGSSSLNTDLKRDLIRNYILQNSSLVDCKVASVDYDWSGIKFMIRVKDR